MRGLDDAIRRGVNKGLTEGFRKALDEAFSDSIGPAFAERNVAIVLAARIMRAHLAGENIPKRATKWLAKYADLLAKLEGPAAVGDQGTGRLGHTNGASK